MEKLLYLHNILRWLIIFNLLVVIIKILLKKDPLKSSKVLLIYAHITLLIGLFQYFFGKIGFQLIKSAEGGMRR
jgi:Flp pilus assembly protein protease CpaA